MLPELEDPLNVPDSGSHPILERNRPFTGGLHSVVLSHWARGRPVGLPGVSKSLVTGMVGHRPARKRGWRRSRSPTVLAGREGMGWMSTGSTWWTTRCFRCIDDFAEFGL